MWRGARKRYSIVPVVWPERSRPPCRPRSRQRRFTISAGEISTAGRSREPRRHLAAGRSRDRCARHFLIEGARRSNDGNMAVPGTLSGGLRSKGPYDVTFVDRELGNMGSTSDVRVRWIDSSARDGRLQLGHESSSTEAAGSILRRLFQAAYWFGVPIPWFNCWSPCTMQNCVV